MEVVAVNDPFIDTKYMVCALPYLLLPVDGHCGFSIESDLP